MTTLFENSDLRLTCTGHWYDFVGGIEVLSDKPMSFFFEEELSVDHVKPWSKGGRTELSNAQLLCRPCNIKQGNRK